jgi:CRP-like cAMP-binding protein
MFETARLPNIVLETVARYAARATWPAGFPIYQRGAVADGIFIVVRGSVVLRSRAKSGRGYVPTIVAPGRTFGGEGLAASATTTPRYVTEARADVVTETLHVGTSQYRALVREQPAAALALSAQVMAEHATLLEKLRELAMLSVEQRLVTSLARMVRQGTFADTDGRLALDPAHYRVLCEVVGATRESVSLVINRLIATGTAERRDGRVYVDSNALQSLSDPALVEAGAGQDEPWDRAPIGTRGSAIGDQALAVGR